MNSSCIDAVNGMFKTIFLGVITLKFWLLVAVELG